MSRVLAGRIQEQLLLHPDLVHAAQRGFLRDGGVDQCVDTVLDVIEDWRQRNGNDRSLRLLLMSYDQAKAYDSVQGYSIRASLERFNMPESFISYVLSGLQGATSCVRTAGGLTKPFNVLSSVRQGDPLAPLIFMFITDALHAGLQECPMKGVDSTGWGHTMARSHTLGPVRVCSSGYCDDAITVATSVESQVGMHTWVREFFGAHSARLNCQKTELICSHRADRIQLSGRQATTGGGLRCGREDSFGGTRL